MENNKQKMAIVALVALLVVGAVGVTIAYFSNKHEIANKFIADQLSVEASEDFTSPTNWLPGDTTEKVVRAHNTSKLPMAVRISYTERWEDQGGNPLALEFEEEKVAIVNLANVYDWLAETKNGETFYYYYKILNPDEITSKFMKSVTFNENAIGGMVCTPREDGRGEECKSSTDYENANYFLNIKIEFIHFDKYKENWDTDIDISESERIPLYEQLKVMSVLDNIQSEFVSSPTGIDFAELSSDTNGKSLYIKSETQAAKYPILYYRGAVINNNLLFADLCWKIVRTTETGGVKIIYNGLPNSGQCNNTGVDSQLTDLVAFNEMNTDAKYVGYTYDINTDSNVKQVIDEWYEENIENNLKHLHYGEYLEDTVWCNDRSIFRTSGNSIFYGAFGRLNANKAPSLECSQQADKYTLKKGSTNYDANLNGNQLLDYPVALLTADEVALAGAVNGKWGTTHYLYTSQHYWLMSVYSFSNSNVWTWDLRKDGSFGNGFVERLEGVRPALSLVPGIKAVTIGEGEAGTESNPYIIVEN